MTDRVFSPYQLSVVHCAVLRIYLLL